MYDLNKTKKILNLWKVHDKLRFFQLYNIRQNRNQGNYYNGDSLKPN